MEVVLFINFLCGNCVFVFIFNVNVFDFCDGGGVGYVVYFCSDCV